MDHISIEDFYELIKEKGSQNLNIIDVRLAQGFNNNHIKGAVNIPLSNFPGSLDQLDKSKKYYVICQVGASSSQGTQFLQQHGYQATNVDSGMMNYPGETVSK